MGHFYLFKNDQLPALGDRPGDAMRCDAMRDATALRAHRPGSAQGCSAPATKPLHEPINFEESKSNPVRVETKTNESRFMYIGQRIDQCMFRSESIRNFKFM